MREIVFGLEDSLVSTLGTITGIAVGTNSQYVVILSGAVLLASEAMSMAAGSYLSSKRAFQAEAVFHDHGGAHNAEAPRPLRAALVMGTCYVAGGFIPLAFYLFLPVASAVIPAVILTAASLFLVGVWAASFTKTSKWKSGLEMTAVSLAAAAAGYLIGRGVGAAFGVAVVL